jgi:hypothetical protein
VGSGTNILERPPFALPRVARRPRLAHSILARLRAPSVDRQFAGGIASWRSPVHAARALQLTSGRRRRNVARSLELLIEHAEQPRSLTAAVSPCRAHVRDARPVLLRTAAQLRSNAPVDVRGVVRLRELLSDGGGPCYIWSHPQALTSALETAAQWLDAPD